MPWLDRKYTLIFIGLLLIFGVIYWVLGNREPEVTQTRMLEWIQQGYPSQFCTNIFPKLADCLTISVSQCEDIAEQQVQPCVDEIAQIAPQSMTPAQSNQYYLQSSSCFERNMHAAIMRNYLKDTTECQQRMQ